MWKMKPFDFKANFLGERKFNEFQSVANLMPVCPTFA